MAVLKRQNSGSEFVKIPPEFFYQNLANASGRGFSSLYDAIHQFKKFELS
jgi:hypothetical protein